MNFSKIDLFSSQFYFNVKKSQIRKGTLAGSLLSIVIVTLTVCYLAYLFNLYISNLIDPNYKAQNFSNEDFNQLEITEDLFAFRYEQFYNPGVESHEKQANTTLVVYKVYFIQISQVNYEIIPIDFVKCTIPTLDGYYCLNLSNLQNKTLISSNTKKVESQIQINLYGCRDLDSVKTTIPDNCASEDDINNSLNSMGAGLRIKQILTTVKIQKQKTSVKQGYLIQRQFSFSSPLQYNLENQTLDRQSAMQLVNVGPANQITFLVDDLFQEIEIQYPAIAQILALVNSIFSILMLLGFIGRSISWRSIKQDFFLLLLQNNYQDLYLQIIQQIKPNKQIISTTNDKKYQENINLSSEQKAKQLVCMNQQLEQQLDNESELQLDVQNQEDSLQQVQKLSRSINFKNKQDLDLQNSINDKYVKRTVSKFFEEKNDHQKNKKLFQKRNNEINNKNFFVPSSNVKQKKAQQINLEQSDVSKQLTLNLELGQNLSMCSEVSTQKHNSFVQHKTPFSSSEHVQLYKNSLQQNNQSYIQKLQVIKDNNIPAKIQNMILKNINIYSNKSFNLKQKIENQVEQELDIFKLYKDIIFLKKAVSILLSQEQLASLELVGCSSSFLEIDLNQVQDITTMQQTNKMTHYEKQIAILNSNELQYNYILNFLKRCQNNQKLSYVDQRIYSSILANTFN